MGQHRAIVVLVEGATPDRRVCEACGQATDAGHGAEGRHERLLSVLTANVWTRPKACLALLRVLSRPDLPVSEVARAAHLRPATLFNQVKRLKGPGE